jgi:hypothetical protein
MTELESNIKLREGIREIRFGLQELLIGLSTDSYTTTPNGDAKQDFFDEIVESSQATVGGDLYRKALAIITDLGYASTIVLQTRLDISYQQALLLVARLERDGLVASAHGFRPHKALSAAYELRDRIASADFTDSREEPA